MIRNHADLQHHGSERATLFAAGFWRLTPEHAKILKAWLPSLIWTGLIAVESTAMLSAANTSRFLYGIFHYLTGVSHARFEVWHFYIRKTGHFVGYFTLSFLLFGAWRATVSVPGSLHWAFRWAWIAWLMTAFVASMDEWHQTFIPSRTGTVHDVVLDSTAALVAQITLFLYWNSRKTRGVFSVDR